MTESFLHKEDLFICIDGKGKGVWGLRDMAQHFSSEEKYEIAPEYRAVLEGEFNERKVMSYTRNQQQLRARKTKDNYTCLGCGFSYQQKIVECHHLEPLHYTGKRLVTMDDMVTLCPNCHAMAHVWLKEGGQYTQRDVLLDRLKKEHAVAYGKNDD